MREIIFSGVAIFSYDKPHHFSLLLTVSYYWMTFDLNINSFINGEGNEKKRLRREIAPPQKEQSFKRQK